MDHNQSEFSQIYTAYWPKIARYLARMVGEEEAEDLTQEVFIKVGQALPGFRGESSLSTWLYRIATNTAYDRLRSPSFQNWQGDHRAEEEGEDRDACLREKKQPVEQQFVKKEMETCIWSYLAKLPESYRSVLVLSDLEELSNKEIADILGVTLGTVKIRLHRARSSLREELETHCEYYWVSELSWRPA
jgi:RNA polymerase sigma-70 factor (ECF subfamily)